MSLSRKRMMYSLVGMAGMTHYLHSLHARGHHHHGPRLDMQEAQASDDAAAARTPKVPGVTGQGQMKFKVLYTSDRLPSEARKVLKDAHGGFAVDRRPGREETYFALPGAGIVRVSGDLKTIDLVETPDEMRRTNLHDTNIWYGSEGTPYLVFPANSEGKIYTTTVDGKLVHKLDAPTAEIKFEQQAVHDYFLGGGNFVPTAVEYLDGLYYITTGYSNLDYVLTAKVSAGRQFEASWNDLAWGGKGNAIGQFNTGHGITRVPGIEQLDVADRPNSRIERFTKYGHFVSVNPMPSASLPCDVNYLDPRYSVVPALEGPDRKKGAPIYVLEHGKLVSTIMIKEDLGLPNFTHIHNAAIRKIGAKFHILALAWNPGDFAILEQV